MKPVPPLPASRTLLLMVALMVGVFLSPMNVNFTTVALPTMRDAFSVNVELASWIGTAYFIPSVVLMPVLASLGERWGVRRMYVLGLLVLSLGGFLASAAQNFSWLLASRAIQGIGWSGLYPLALGLIRMYFPIARQGEIVGIWESAVGLATIVSPVIGGALVDFLGWSLPYLVLGAVAASGALLAFLVIPQDPPGHRRSDPDFDWRGSSSFTLALTLSLLGAARRSPVLLLVGGLAWALWLQLARRASAPFIAPNMLANRAFLSASLAANLRMLIAIATLIALPLFFEDVQGLRPSLVGSLMVIYSLFLFLAAWPGGRWTDRSGARAPGSVGYLAMIIGVLLLLMFDSRLSVPLVALALAIRGIGAGLSQSPYAKAATEAVDSRDIRMAAGLYGTIRYSGLAMGTALAGILLQLRLTHYRALSGGPEAIPAYRELWLVLAVLGLLGLSLTRLIGKGNPAEADTVNRVR